MSAPLPVSGQARRNLPGAASGWTSAAGPGEELARAELRRLSRALAPLVGRGYVVRSGGRRRTTHIKLTVDGKALARAILETEDGDPVFLPIPWEEYEGGPAEEGPNASSAADEARGDDLGGDEGRE